VAVRKLKENLFIDSNIKIQTLPEELVGSTLIKTSIKDRWNQEDSFLTFNLLVPSYIYIAIDLYFNEVPDWLDEDFDFIVLKQIVTDPQSQRGFMLFKSKNIFQPGKVNLGGNFANGSISPPIELMMYTVFVKPVDHILPYVSGDTVTYKDFLGFENDLNTFQYQIETIDAVGNISRGIESTPIILDLSGHCKPNITKWYNYENDSHQRFAKGQIKQVSIQNPHLIPQCSNFRATDSLRFQAVREEIVLFDQANKVDVKGRFFDSGWLSVDDLQEPFSYKFNLLPETKDLNFVNGKKYYYRVRAKDVFNNYSVWSDTVSAIQDVFPPGDINNLTAETEVIENIGDGCIRLNWNHAEDPVSGIFKYIIYRSEDQGNSFVGVDSLPGSQNTFCDAFSNLNDNKVFYYRVGSMDGVGNIFDFRNSNWEVAIRALKGPVISAPKSDLIECKNGLVGITNDSILVEWQEFNPDGVNGYEIHI